MNFINRQTEPMPDGAAQSHEQPTVEKSIADALMARVEKLEFILSGYHTDTKCGSCKGPLEEERDAICKRCTMESELTAAREILVKLRAKITRERDGATGYYEGSLRDACDAFLDLMDAH